MHVVIIIKRRVSLIDDNIQNIAEYSISIHQMFLKRVRLFMFYKRISARDEVSHQQLTSLRVRLTWP